CMRRGEVVEIRDGIADGLTPVVDALRNTENVPVRNVEDRYPPVRPSARARDSLGDIRSTHSLAIVVDGNRIARRSAERAEIMDAVTVPEDGMCRAGVSPGIADDLVPVINA